MCAYGKRNPEKATLKPRAQGAIWSESSQRHLLGRDAPEILLSLLDTAQIFQTQAFQQLHQALIIR